MAGMFSMLNAKLRNDNSGNVATGSTRDEGSTARSNMGVRSQAKKRQNFKRAPLNGKMWTAYPRDMGKPRIIELHPLMRRSVCTLIVALVVIMSGIIVILVQLFTEDVYVSVAGWAVTGTGLCLVVLGVIWFHTSKNKLKRKWEKREQKREKKIKLMMSKFQKTNSTPMSMAASNHVAKWPTKQTCNADECQVTVTSPNGNHYFAAESSIYSESEDGSIPALDDNDFKSTSGAHSNGKTNATTNGFKAKLKQSLTKNNKQKQSLTETTFLGEACFINTPTSFIMPSSFNDTTV